jgi:GDP-L-fucose synthase
MRIYVAGIRGMVGSAVAREARKLNYEVLGKSSVELDLTNREAVFSEIESVRPEVLVISAAKVGGIAANNNFPVDFLSINLLIQTNLIDAAYKYEVEKVIFLGSSCIYPKFAEQPIKEKSLLTGPLEPTNEPYAIAKIAGVKLIESYNRQYLRKWISLMPTNLYGKNDNFDLETSHVLPALINRFTKAVVNGANDVEIWGDGTPLREFLYVDDLARAIIFLLNKSDVPHILNIGSGEEISIFDLSHLVAKIVGFEGSIKFNTNMPNGTPRKLLDSSLIRNLGWQSSVTLQQGIRETYQWYVENEKVYSK